MNVQHVPAPRVTGADGDASDAKRGVTRMVTRNAEMVTQNARMVTRSGVTRSLASPVSAAREAIWNVPGDASDAKRGHPLPPLFEKGVGVVTRKPGRRYPRKGPASRVTIVTIPGGAKTSPRFLRLARTCASHLEGMNR